MQEPGVNKIDTSGREVKAAGGRGATTMTSRVDWYNLFILLLSTIAISGIVSLYVLCLAWLNLKNTGTDPLERAARSAAADLLKITTVSRDFGTLGIADYVSNDNDYSYSPEGATGNVRSFNTVGTLIRSSLFVAKRYQLAPMGERAASDLKELKRLADELQRRFLAAIKDDGTGKIYEHIKRILTSSPRSGEHLESLKVTLGTIKNKLTVSAIQAEPEDDAANCLNGRLRALTPLTVPLIKDTLVLHQQASETTIVDSADFVQSANPPSTIPTVIFIEAQFATNSDKRSFVISKRRVCVVAGADIKNQPYSVAPLEGCLAVSFPHGKPNAFSSLESILRYKDWQGKGEWQQAVQGSVPGTGQLTPSAAPLLKEMNPSESLSIALYHWLRQLSRPAAPASLSAMIKATWKRPPAARDSGTANPSSGEEETFGEDPFGDDAAVNIQVNSGLLKDSDARRFALLYQNKPAEAGQKALTHCFQALPSRFPPSTLPLVVDNQGEANLPGRRGFDQKLAFDLLTSIYSTNLAAHDSLAAAKLIQSSALRACRTSKERLFLAQTELDSLSKRLRSVTDRKEEKVLNNEIDWRKNRIAYEVNEQKKQLTAISLAQLAITNATTVAGQSFACGSKLFQLARAGINRLDHFQPDGHTGQGEKSGYLLGKRYIFWPLTESLQENDIFDEAARAFESSSVDKTSPDVKALTASATVATVAGRQRSPWLAKKLSIFGTVRKLTDLPATQIMVEGRSLSDLKAEAPPVLKAEPTMVVFTPRLLANGANQSPLYFRVYPFKGLAVPESQLIYYCQNGYRSASPPAEQKESLKIEAEKAVPGAVAWSILVRDLVVNRDINSAHQHLGLPLVPPMSGWCKRALNINVKGQSGAAQNSSGDPDETCPGLAGEWQLRSPVMFLNDSASGILKGTTLSDPESGQRVPQIPPVGPDLM